MPTSPYRDTVLADGASAYWRLGELHGTTAADEKGAYNGRYMNGPTLGQVGALSGDPNPAVTFDGVNDYVRVPYNAALNASVLSVETWVFPTGRAGAYRTIVASRNWPKGWVLYAADNNTWEFWLNSGAGMVVLSGPAVALNAWTHLVGTFDGTTARFYVNGALVRSGTPTSYTPNSSQTLNIGRGESTGYFPGRIDEVSVYSRALSASQVQAHYNVGINGSAPGPNTAMAQ